MFPFMSRDLAEMRIQEMQDRGAAQRATRRAHAGTEGVRLALARRLAGAAAALAGACADDIWRDLRASEPTLR